MISKGTTLTVTLIERVQNFARTRGVREPIQVRAPQGSYADELQRALGAHEIWRRSMARATASLAKHIMAVDDQPANLKLLEELLSQQGYIVRSFPRGRLALEAAARNPPDLILLDINMPEMSGFKVCELLKADEKLARIPVIFLSALTDVSDKVQAFQCGGVDYVTKPFQVDEVQARVQTHLNMHRLQKELQLHANHLEELVASRTRELAEISGAVESARPGQERFLEADPSRVAFAAQRACWGLENWCWRSSARLKMARNFAKCSNCPGKGC